MIQNFLTNHCIVFESQKRFSKCRFKKPLPFDFYLPTFNVCIEFDGEQHFKTRSKYYHNQIFNNDNIKTTFCQNQNIKLLRISYKEINKISNILKSFLGIVS